MLSWAIFTDWKDPMRELRGGFSLCSHRLHNLQQLLVGILFRHRRSLLHLKLRRRIPRFWDYDVRHVLRWIIFCDRRKH